MNITRPEMVSKIREDMLKIKENHKGCECELSMKLREYERLNERGGTLEEYWLADWTSFIISSSQL